MRSTAGHGSSPCRHGSGWTVRDPVADLAREQLGHGRFSHEALPSVLQLRRVVTRWRAARSSSLCPRAHELHAAWKCPIGWPELRRTFAYDTACSYCRLRGSRARGALIRCAAGSVSCMQRLSSVAEHPVARESGGPRPTSTVSESAQAHLFPACHAEARRRDRPLRTPRCRVRIFCWDRSPP